MFQVKMEIDADFIVKLPFVFLNFKGSKYENCEGCCIFFLDTAILQLFNPINYRV